MSYNKLIALLLIASVFVYCTKPNEPEPEPTPVVDAFDGFTAIIEDLGSCHSKQLREAYLNGDSLLSVYQSPLAKKQIFDVLSLTTFGAFKFMIYPDYHPFSLSPNCLPSLNPYHINLKIHFHYGAGFIEILKVYMYKDIAGCWSARVILNMGGPALIDFCIDIPTQFCHDKGKAMLYVLSRLTEHIAPHVVEAVQHEIDRRAQRLPYDVATLAAAALVVYITWAIANDISGIGVIDDITIPPAVTALAAIIITLTQVDEVEATAWVSSMEYYVRANDEYLSDASIDTVVIDTSTIDTVIVNNTKIDTLIDTKIVIDTSIITVTDTISDTTTMIDTIINTIIDTVKKDTIIIDTVIDTTSIIDTVTITDTTTVIDTVSDTTVIIDTVSDTTVIIDTTTVTDTVVITDTLDTIITVVDTPSVSCRTPKSSGDPTLNNIHFGVSTNFLLEYDGVNSSDFTFEIYIDDDDAVYSGPLAIIQANRSNSSYYTSDPVVIRKVQASEVNFLTTTPKIYYWGAKIIVDGIKYEADKVIQVNLQK